ncbi:hypothetical protein ACQ4PT_060401 [Festuca glaucescens]
MDETRSGVCEVEKVPGIGVHGDESDNSRTGLGDESLSASENIFVGSRSDNSMISEHGREANIIMDSDNDYERDICEVTCEENSNEIRFDIIEEEENVFVTALDIEDYSKELFKEVFYFEGDAKSIFISKTVELKNSEIININSRVYDRGLGLGGVFVHRLSTYDVASNALTIVSVLDVHRSGDIYFLRGEDDDDSHAVYYTSVDGRIRFKSGWSDFCVKNNLVAGQLVLCLFFKMEGMLFMSVDVIE